MTKTKIIGEIISLVLNPLLILVPVPFFLVYEKTGSVTLSLVWTAVSVFFILVYFLAILIGIRIGIFSDFDISRREQRPLLFSIGMVLTLIYFAALFLFHAPGILIIGTIAIILGLIVLGVVNMFTKASAHMAVLSALLTSLLIAEGWKALFGILLLPLLAWARIKTRNHTLLQTALGTLLGVATILALYVIFKYIIKYG
ncbi:MAG: hypothetical protein ABSD69_00325 [Candidatus Levyibacteriota bacterium]|jgi:hypothetical protein